MGHRTNRRQFLSRCRTVAVSAGLHSTLAYSAEPGRAPKNASNDIPIIDTHQHLWDLERFQLPWLKTELKLARNYSMNDYLDATRGLHVTQSIYMEVDVAPAQQKAEAEYVLAICQRSDTPMAAAVISGRPNSDQFRSYMHQFKGSKYIKGLRQVLHVPTTPRGYCLEKNFIKGIRLLGDMGFSFDLCMRETELQDGAKLIEACPETRFILDHCGNAEVRTTDRTPWRQGIAAVASYKNVVCKISGIIASAKPKGWTPEDLAPIINYTVEVFGKDRIMFGGDWPVCTLAASYREWVGALKSVIHDWAPNDQHKLFHKNAAKFYGLA